MSSIRRFWNRLCTGYRIRGISLVVLVSGLLGCAGTPEGIAPPLADIAFVGVDVLTMEHPELLRDQTVLIRGPLITSIGPRSHVVVPAKTHVIEGQGRVLMPGLVDAHIHLRHADTTALVDYLRAGVTCAREMNGRPFVLTWRDRIDAGELVGPKLQVSAPTLGNWSSPREGYATPDTREQGVEMVRSFHAAGYDWIKIYTFLPETGFVGVMEEANRLGLPVGCHVPVEVGIRDVLSSGLRSIEHLTEYVGSTLTPEARALDEIDYRSVFGAGSVNWMEMDMLIRETTVAGVWNVPTLVWFDENLPAPMAQEAWSDPDLRAQGAMNRREIVRRLYEAGARLAVGTDSDAGDQLAAGAIHDEIEAMAEAGIPPEVVLRLATVGGSVLLELQEEIGTVTAGKRADLLLLSCDPRNDLSCLRTPEIVVAQGRLVVEK